MNDNAAEQAWQQMYSHIEQMLPRFLKGELRQIEYKSQNIISLLEMPSNYGNKRQKRTSPTGRPDKDKKSKITKCAKE